MNEKLYPELKVMMVDDESHLLHSYELTLLDAGIDNILTCNDSRQVEGLLSNNEVGVLLLDLSMPHITGEELLERIAPEHPNIQIIIITGNNELETAVRCMKNGASDYLLKPIEPSRIISSVKRAIEINSIRAENTLLKESLFNRQLKKPEIFEKIITKDDTMISIFHYMEAISKTSEPILITGETGVGKELIAKAIHELSGRQGKFVTTNVAGLDDQMFTDTLFGHKKGAFTNAFQDRAGLIDRAKGGTVFLDEIGDLSIQSQVKLLRLLQEHEYYALGVDEPKYSDALIIVATNQDLHSLQKNNHFRKDLYYRLNVHHIHIPPLRDRLGDLSLLVDDFLNKAALTFGKKKPTPPPEILTLLSIYDFPGNIRELQAMVFDAVSRHKSKILSLESFKKIILKEGQQFQNQLDEENGSEESKVSFGSALPTLKEAQSELVKEAMKRSKNNQSIAARFLGVTRQALNKRLKDSN